MTIDATPGSMPRVLYVDLATTREPRAELRAFEPRDSLAKDVACFGGTALAAALLFEENAESAFVVAVGPALREGLPTAGRATVAARAPMTGAYGDGQVGSDLGRRLAAVCEALVVRGTRAGDRSALVIEASGACSLLALPDGEVSPQELGSLLEDRLGPCASLRVGPSALAGVEFASLVAGHSPPSMVGRGGLGRSLASTGLVAIAIRAEPVPVSRESSNRERIEAWLHASPRLAMRAEGGTHELALARAARSEAEDSSRWDTELANAKRKRHGCAGCPTPCGYVFENSLGSLQGARFSALEALGTRLGLRDPKEALSLLEDCDHWGMDAKETGALLESVLEQSRARRESGLEGNLESLRERIACIGRGESIFGAETSRGDEAYRVALGLAPKHGAGHVASRPETNLALRLGAAVATRGAEPMRTFPFLVDGSPHGSHEAALLAPLELPDGSDDPLDPAGKGRLVFWHENVATAIDSSGFCAFSAASLLADGVVGLEVLARTILPAHFAASEDAGLAWQLLGARTLRLIQELNARWGRAALTGVEDRERESLAEPGLLSEYLACRGIEDSGALVARSEAALDAAGFRRLAEGLGESNGGHPELVASTVSERKVGTVQVRAFGALGEALSVEPQSAQLPAAVGEFLHELARRHPGVADRLVRGDAVLPAVYRGGVRLGAGDLVRAGDTLDLVLVTAGG